MNTFQPHCRIFKILRNQRIPFRRLLFIFSNKSVTGQEWPKPAPPARLKILSTNDASRNIVDFAITIRKFSEISKTYRSFHKNKMNTEPREENYHMQQLGKNKFQRIICQRTHILRVAHAQKTKALRNTHCLACTLV